MANEYLIYNPAARRASDGRVLRALLSALAEAGHVPTLAPTEAPGHATDLARDMAGAGAEIVFAWGGDGTLREVAAGLAGSGTALGPIPGGTTDVIATGLGLGRHTVRAARCLAGAVRERWDVGTAGDDFFLMQVSGAFDARALLRVDPRIKRRLGRAEVGRAVLLSLARYGLDHVRFELSVEDGGVEVLEAPFGAVCNTAHYAGPFELAPGARPDDGYLDVVALRKRGRFHLAFSLARLVSGRLTASAVHRRRVRSCRLESPEGLQRDGDAWPSLRKVEIGLRPGCLEILVPSLR